MHSFIFSEIVHWAQTEVSARRTLALDLMVDTNDLSDNISNIRPQNVYK